MHCMYPKVPGFGSLGQSAVLKTRVKDPQRCPDAQAVCRCNTSKPRLHVWCSQTRQDKASPTQRPRAMCIPVCLEPELTILVFVIWAAKGWGDRASKSLD